MGGRLRSSWSNAKRGVKGLDLELGAHHCLGIYESEHKPFAVSWLLQLPRCLAPLAYDRSHTVAYCSAVTLDRIVGGKRVMKKLITRVSLLLLSGLFVCGCQQDNQDVAKDNAKARKEIQDAQKSIRKIEAQSAVDLERARASGKLQEVEETKVKATEKLASAESEVDDNKVAATEDIAEATREAGQTSGTFQQD